MLFRDSDLLCLFSNIILPNLSADNFVPLSPSLALAGNHRILQFLCKSEADVLLHELGNCALFLFLLHGRR